MAGREEPLAQEEALEVAAVLLLFRGPLAAFSPRIWRRIPGNAGFVQIVRTRVRAFRKSVFAELMAPTDRGRGRTRIRIVLHGLLPC